MRKKNCDARKLIKTPQSWKKNRKMYKLKKKCKKKIDPEISRGTRKLLRIPWLKKHNKRSPVKKKKLTWISWL